MATQIKSRRKPIRNAVSNAADTFTEATRTAKLTLEVINVHLESFKLEAQLESIEDLAELAGWSGDELTKQKQMVIAQHQAV